MSNSDLNKKEIDIDFLAQKALSDKELLSQLLEGILSKDEVIRSNSFQILKIVTEENPEFIYPRWDYFQEMLYSKNNFLKYIAVYLLANLTVVDVDEKFNGIFDDYFDLLGGSRAMISSHVALNSVVIFKNKPELQSYIVDKLLNIDNIHEGKQIELIKAYVIDSLLEIYPEADNKTALLDFVKDQQDSKSPKTRKKAQEFLDKWNE